MSAVAVSSQSAVTPLRKGSAVRPAPLRLTVRGRRVVATFVASLMMLVLALVGAWVGPAIAGDENPEALRYVTVYYGDTLWGIAEEITTECGDVRATVSELMSLNGLADAVVTPGQQIALPANAD